MVTVLVCSKLKTSWKSVVFTNKVGKNSRYFVGVFSKTIPLALVGYMMIIANSYPTRTRGIIVEYTKQVIPCKMKQKHITLKRIQVTLFQCRGVLKNQSKFTSNMELLTRETVARVLRKTLHRDVKEVIKRALTVLRSEIRPLRSMLLPKWPGLNSIKSDVWINCRI